MIIIGDEYIPYETVCVITHQDEIQSTPSGSTVFFKFDLLLMQYCHKNKVPYAVWVDDIKEAIYANALGAKYCISALNVAKSIQQIADDYLFDTKNLVQITSSEMIYEAALSRIDGVIYTHVAQV